MADPHGTQSTSLLPVLLVFLGFVHLSGCQDVEVPKHLQGNFFSIEIGKDVDTFINHRYYRVDGGFNGEIVRLTNYNTTDIEGRHDSDMIFFSRDANCYMCVIFYWRTPNIIQYKYTGCNGYPTVPTVEQTCGFIPAEKENYTFFSKEYNVVNCKNTFEGVYHFTYEMQEGGGSICNSPNSYIEACQLPGSPYKDNEVMYMYFGRCPDVSTSIKQETQFLCMGSWTDGKGNYWSAVADNGEDVIRVRYRCMLTRKDQEEGDNKVRYSMSWWADCSELITPYEGPLRLVMQPVVGGTQLKYTNPTCNFPTNYAGHWFHRGELDVDVDINSTHVYFKTRQNEYMYKETYFICLMNTGTRYLTVAITIGKCEIDYLCFDMMPRHHSIIRWRMSKPYRMPDEQTSLPNFEDYIFRQACSWSSFTIDRDNIDWNYKTFLLNPPVPIACPIRGRYRFIQTGPESELIKTRIRGGITVRPRHQIGCEHYITEWKSCDQNPTKISLDAEYCETVDHTGRPIGEYDEADWELSCVGYWQEDWRMYMVTWDQEDPTSAFRCWAYERTDWRYVVASRSTGPSCPPMQKAWSNSPEEGASLRFELEENERLYDDCAQGYRSGSPYKEEQDFFRAGLSSAQNVALSWSLLSCPLLFMCRYLL